MHERSDSYKRIKDRVVKEYQTGPTQLWAKHWFAKFAPKWRNRVGIPRLTAQEVAAEALERAASDFRGGYFYHNPLAQDHVRSQLLDRASRLREGTRR